MVLPSSQLATRVAGAIFLVRRAQTSFTITQSLKGERQKFNTEPEKETRIQAPEIPKQNKRNKNVCLFSSIVIHVIPSMI